MEQVKKIKLMSGGSTQSRAPVPLNPRSIIHFCFLDIALAISAISSSSPDKSTSSLLLKTNLNL